MRYFQLSRRRKIIFAILFLLLVGLIYIVAVDQYKKLTSQYKYEEDFGGSLYADDYVKSGNWVFNCWSGSIYNKNKHKFPTGNVLNFKNIKYSYHVRYGEDNKKILEDATEYFFSHPELMDLTMYGYSKMLATPFIGRGIINNNVFVGRFTYNNSYFDYTFYLGRNVESPASVDFFINEEKPDAPLVSWEKSIRQAVVSCPGPQELPAALAGVPSTEEGNASH
jgi:hypothetical protein